MNRTIKRIAAGLACLLATSGYAQALAESYGDEHCFTRSPTGNIQPGDVVYLEEQQGAILSHDEGQVLAERVWEIRLGQHNWLYLDRAYLNQFDVAQSRTETGVPPAARPLYEEDAFAVRLNEIHADHMSRLTGSRHIYVSPALRRLARERAAVRQAQRRDCNPHILYLGG